MLPLDPDMQRAWNNSFVALNILFQLSTSMALVPHVFKYHLLRWASIHWAGERLTVRSPEVSKPRDSSLDIYNRSGIWQRCCRGVCQISEWCDHLISRLRDFTRFGGKTPVHLVDRTPGFLYENLYRFPLWSNYSELEYVCKSRCQVIVVWDYILVCIHCNNE